jgi:DNA-binding CsgD family transcriptional regulator
MYDLTRQDLSALLRTLPDLYEPCDLEAFRLRVLTAIRRLVRCDSIVYNEVNVRRGTDTWLSQPADALDFSESHQIFERHLSEHPLIAHHAKRRDARVLKISDFLSQRQLHDLGLYQEFFRRVGTEYQMACVLSTRSPMVIGIALNRCDKDFSERERSMVAVASPHLLQAHSNAKAFARTRGELASINEALERQDKAVVVLKANGVIQSCSRLAERWLQDYFGARCAAGRLPPALERWVTEQHTRVNRMEVLEPLIVKKARTLIVRLFLGGSHGVVIMSEDGMTLSPRSLEALGLSHREAEVLACLADGRTNSEIATMLNLSARTVQKHLEHIFETLGVESRTAAANRAWRLRS